MHLKAYFVSTLERRQRNPGLGPTTGSRALPKRPRPAQGCSLRSAAEDGPGEGLGEAGPGDPAPGRGRVESGPSQPVLPPSLAPSFQTGQSNGTQLGSRGSLQG